MKVLLEKLMEIVINWLSYENMVDYKEIENFTKELKNLLEKYILNYKKKVS